MLFQTRCLDLRPRWTRRVVSRRGARNPRRVGVRRRRGPRLGATYAAHPRIPAHGRAAERHDLGGHPLPGSVARIAGAFRRAGSVLPLGLAAEVAQPVRRSRGSGAGGRNG